jgi:chromosome segregation ATPase
MAKSKKGRRSRETSQRRAEFQFQEGILLRHPLLEGLLIYLVIVLAVWKLIGMMTGALSAERTLTLSLAFMLVPNIVFFLYRFYYFPEVGEVSKSQKEILSLRRELKVLRAKFEKRGKVVPDGSEESPKTTIEGDAQVLQLSLVERKALEDAARSANTVVHRLERANARLTTTNDELLLRINSLENKSNGQESAITEAGSERNRLLREIFELRAVYDTLTFQLLSWEHEARIFETGYRNLFSYYSTTTEILPYLLAEMEVENVGLKGLRQEVQRYEKAFSHALDEIEYVRGEVDQLKKALSSAVRAGFGFRQERDHSYAEVLRIDEAIEQNLKMATTLLADLIKNGNGLVTETSLLSFWEAFTKGLNASTSPSR